MLVDESRLLVCDLEMLGAWQVDEPVDGLFDIAFWGRDPDTVARRLGADRIEQVGGSVFGWRDLDREAAAQRAGELHSVAEGVDDLLFAVDIRPHDTSYALLRQAWVEPTGAGVVELGDWVATGWFTAGEGAYPVYRDLDVDGALQRIRVDLA